MDAVEKAQSGHPGTPMGLSDITFEIFTRYLRYDPRDPAWIGRDRFVLSCGHASMLLYAMLHLSGYDLPLSEIEIDLPLSEIYDGVEFTPEPSDDED